MSCCRSTLDSVKICYEAWNYHVCIFRDTNNMRSPWQKFQKLAQAPLKAPPMLCLIPLTQLTGKKLAKLESERCLFGCLFVFMCIFHMHKRDVSSHIPSPSKNPKQNKNHSLPTDPNYSLRIWSEPISFSDMLLETQLFLRGAQCPTRQGPPSMHRTGEEPPDKCSEIRV